MTHFLLPLKRVSTCHQLRHFNTKTIKNKVSTCHQFNNIYKNKSDQQLQMSVFRWILQIGIFELDDGASAYFIHFLFYFSSFLENSHAITSPNIWMN